MIEEKLTVQDISDYISFVKENGDESGSYFLVSRFFDISYEEVLGLEFKDFELLNRKVQNYMSDSISLRNIVDIVKEAKSKKRIKTKERINRNELMDLE